MSEDEKKDTPQTDVSRANTFRELSDVYEKYLSELYEMGLGDALGCGDSLEKLKKIKLDNFHKLAIRQGTFNGSA